MLKKMKVFVLAGLFFALVPQGTLQASDMQPLKLQPQLYSMWNHFPQVEANDRYFSLQEAQAGKITEDELISKVEVTDREDGAGKNDLLVNSEGHEWITLPDYSAQEFTGMQHDGTVSVMIQAEDSAGAVTQKKITVHVTDVRQEEILPVEYRYIEERYIDTLSEDSVWIKREEYNRTLQESLNNKEQAIQSWYFDKDGIKEAKQYTKTHGFADYKESRALTAFFEQFYP